MNPVAVSAPSAPHRSGMTDRRQRKPDLWARVFRYLTVLVYPLLVLYFLIFFGFASKDRDQVLVQKLGIEAAAESRGDRSSDLFQVLPVLVAGGLIGGVGLVLNRKRARRRSDYNYHTQLGLTVMSVIGLVIFFLLR